MPKRQFNIEKFVSYDADSNKSTCLIETCRKELCGKLKGNIKRHYKLVHKQDIKSDDESDSDYAPVCKKSRKSIKLSTTMNKNDFLKCCVGLVTQKNIPFRIFDDQECFKQLIAPYEEKFNINLTSSNIGTILERAGSHIKSQISALVKQKMVCLKIDIASRMGRSVLGINIQYIKDYKICINTVGVIQFGEEHSPTNLIDQILNCLKSYDIELHQIYSTTMDNGAHANRFCHILQELQVQEGEKHYSRTHEENDKIDEIEEKIQSCLKPSLPFATSTAHAIQLAANDVLKTLQTPIEDCRKAFLIISANGEYPELAVLDNTTRWNCVFEMLNSLLHIKNFIDSQFLDKLDSNVDWSFVSEFVTAFTPLVRCMDLLQEEQYVLGDFYRDWLNCEIELEDISSVIALKLHNAMQNRRKLFVENDAFLAALYLDPRFNFTNSAIISEQQKSRALEHLVKTFEIIRKLESSMDNSVLNENISIFSNGEIEIKAEEPCTSNTAYAKLAQRIMTSAVNRSRSDEIKLTFREKLFKFPNTKMVPLDTDILAYFRATPLDADVLKVINVALAVPANQVSVERALSALASTLINLKSNLDDSILNNLLTTKLNFAEIRPCDVALDFSKEDLNLAYTD